LESLNELELRAILNKRKNPKEQLAAIIRRILDVSLSWEDKRALWHYLFASGKEATVVQGLIEGLKSKSRVPFDLLIALCAKNNVSPTPLAITALLKGLSKQKAADELLASTGWDGYDPRLPQKRHAILNEKIALQRQFKQDLLDKFDFLRTQRMVEQARRVLRQLIQLYPEDVALKGLKNRFDEDWAREVLASHAADRSHERLERTLTAPSSSDAEMLKCFSAFAERASMENRADAPDLALIFLLMEDYNRALEIIAWAAPSLSVDWLKAELLLLARRFIEALEHLNQLEIKYSHDPESTFAISYLRARCLYALGQQATALDMLRSIVQIRPHYRSAHALILNWTEGVTWE
jgi:tetratricopeptide (TPR) repeat protein